MKKVTAIIVALFVLSFSNNIVNAQKSKEGNVGNLAFELQINPLNINTDMFSVDALTGRYTLRNGDNLRVELTFGMAFDNGRANLTIPNRDNYPSIADYESALETYNYALKSYDKTCQGHFGINLGYEHFFNKSERLRPYVGAQVGLTKNFVSQHTMRYSQSYSGTNWYWVEQIYKNCDANNNVAALLISIGAFTGVDFYIYEGLYIGAELKANAAWASTLNFSMKRKTNSNNVTDKEVLLEYDGRNGMIQIDYSVTPMLRLGWRF